MIFDQIKLEKLFKKLSDFLSEFPALFGKVVFGKIRSLYCMYMFGLTLLRNNSAQHIKYEEKTEGHYDFENEGYFSRDRKK